MITRSTFKVSFAIVLATFFIGVGWGVWRNHLHRRQMQAATPLRVLCGENWLSPNRLDDFSERHHVPIQLYTYARPTELLSQLANVDGKIDVLCVSSFLVRSLAHARWIKTGVYQDLPQTRNLHVDFVHLPFDPKAEYGLPLFWNLHGLYGSGENVSLKTAAHAGIVLFAEPLSLLDLLALNGVRIEEHLEQETTRGFTEGARAFLKGAARLEWPSAPSADLLGKAAWAAVPLARVAGLIDEKHRFELPDEGGALEIGLLTVGERAPNPELALKLVDELLKPEAAMETHRRLKAGLVHRTFENVETLSVWVRPQALRRFPLTKLRFPDVNVEAIPPFGKVFAEFESVNGGRDRNQ